VFPVRYELNFYIFRRNSVFKGLIIYFLRHKNYRTTLVNIVGVSIYSFTSCVQ
jgi:hypothetical protein